MHRMNPDLWGLFHDGTIEALSRPGPGVVEVRISILYLREMFRGAGDCFVVTLHGCSRFRYRLFEGESTENLSQIALAAPEILHVSQRPDLVLLCTGGELDITYDSMAVALDTGEAVSVEQLVQAAQRYWDGWEATNRRPST